MVVEDVVVVSRCKRAWTVSARLRTPSDLVHESVAGIETLGILDLRPPDHGASRHHRCPQRLFVNPLAPRRRCPSTRPLNKLPTHVHPLCCW